MSTHKRLTEPIDVRLYMARVHLERSRACLANGHPLAAMFRIGEAIVNLQKIEAKLDAADAD